MGVSVTIPVRPQCDFCDEPAYYDAKTVSGPWAYMCEEHWEKFRFSKELGTGRGQRLIVANYA